MNVENVDVLIIGAGPSGTVAASIVNQAGLSVKIVEKSIFPRFVIGESLLPRCMEHFEAAGFIDAIEKQNFQQKFGAVFLMGDKSCDFDFSEQYTEGWKWTWQVPRAEFDKTLADEVERQGVPIDYQTTVTGVEFEGPNSTTTMVDKNGVAKQIKAKYIIDSSGYGRVLSRLLDLDAPSDFPPRKSIFAHLKDPNRPEGRDSNRIQIIAHKQDLWVWMISFSNGNTSVGFVGNPEELDGFGETSEEKFRNLLKETKVPERFLEADNATPFVDITGYSSKVKKLYGDGFVLTGNASEFLDPVFSSGVTFATESGHLAADLIVKEVKGGKVDWDKEYVEHIAQGVDTFRSYVLGWYNGDLQSIFFSDKVEDGIKRKICSVLAGYVWDMKNPFVRTHQQTISNLSRFLRKKFSFS
jgi:flavin-dependent dehydrogenase